MQGVDWDNPHCIHTAEELLRVINEIGFLPLFSNEVFSYEIKSLAGFGKGGEKNFEGTLAKLQMQTYLAVRDFRQKVNKRGEGYGWAIAVYTLPECLWGYDFVTSRYSEEPDASLQKIIKNVRKHFRDAEEKNIRGLV